MGISHEFHRIAVDKVQIPEGRQRKTQGNVQELAESIRRVGLIHPITVTRDLTLVTGATRLSAFRLLASQDPANLRWKTIDAQYIDELSPHQIRLIELEENIRRTDLDWKDVAMAYLEYYEMRGPQYTVEGMAGDVGVQERWIYRVLQVARALREGDSNVMAAGGIMPATNVLKRKLDAAAEVEAQLMLEAERVGAMEPTADDVIAILSGEVPDEPEAAIAEQPMEEEVLLENFLNFCQYYHGPKFNLIHCDFPYGIDHHQSEQGGALKFGTYDDRSSNFWSLIDALFEHREKLLAPSGHLILWFSMLAYQSTFNRLRQADLVVLEHPLIWYKSDRIGIAPDVKRRPRQVYETAFFCSWGDKKILSPLPNCVAWRADKRNAVHQSEKPEGMLGAFFKMMVDDSTSLLDPTCGSGSALAAGLRLGARVLGMDIQPKNVETAKRLVARARLQMDTGIEDEEDVSLDDLTGPSDAELDEINLEDLDVDI